MAPHDVAVLGRDPKLAMFAGSTNLDAVPAVKATVEETIKGRADGKENESKHWTGASTRRTL